MGGTWERCLIHDLAFHLREVVHLVDRAELRNARRDYRGMMLLMLQLYGETVLVINDEKFVEFIESNVLRVFNRMVMTGAFALSHDNPSLVWLDFDRTFGKFREAREPHISLLTLLLVHDFI
jgi:hypothetical protein